jgi:mRNA interferase MazF
MPERGEVWLVDFGITQKVRPALVISVPYADIDRALLGVIPHTTATRDSAFEVSIPARFLSDASELRIDGRYLGWIIREDDRVFFVM